MIVIPMAGASQRFRDAGYQAQKYRLQVHGETVFARSVGSFSAYFDHEDFLFIAREDADVVEFVRAEATRLGVASFETVILPRPTAGQADTVAQGIDRAGIGGSAPLTIFNIDTFRPGFRYPEAPWITDTDGYLEVMPGEDPGFSYARPDPDAGEARVAETAEKRVISNLASTGLYYFRRADLFRSALDEARRAPSGPELYVAPLYNHLIAQGASIHYHLIGADQVIFCGTPAQYEALQASPPSGSQ